MKKSEILRRRELFKRVALAGNRLDGHLLRCTFLLLDEGKARLQVGFKIPSRKLNAVRRNRIRRLLREAFSQELPALISSAVNSSARIGLIVFYKGAKDVAVERISMAQIQQDVHMFCRAIALSM